MESEDVWLSRCEEDAFEKYVWHFDMLNHDERTDAFELAFKRLPQAALMPCSQASRVGTAKPQHQNGLALDLGCGSGLLGLMLLTQRLDCSSLQVVSVEGDAELARVARDNIRESRFGKRMEVCSCLSTRLGKDVQSSLMGGRRANLVISELFDSPLLGEGVLPSLRDASRRLLAPGYFSVPCRVDVYGVVIESAYVRSLQQLIGANGLPTIPKEWGRDDGDARPHEVNLERLLSSAHTRKLTKPFKALSIDFEALPPESGQHVSLQVECLESGSADAVVFWWRCVMVRGDAEDTPSATLHNAPSMPGDPDHWRQAVCILETPNGGRHCGSGELLQIHASHNDDLIWFHLQRTCVMPTRAKYSPLTPYSGSSRLSELSSWRLRMLNNRRRITWLTKAVDACLRKHGLGRKTTKGKQLSIVDLSQGGLLSSLCLARLCHGLGPQKPPFISKKLRHLVLAAREHRHKRGGGVAASLQIKAMGAGKRIGYDLAEAIWTKCGLRQRCRVGAPDLSFSSTPPETVDILLAEPYDGNVEERECDLQYWQHWAQVHDFQTSLHDDSIVFPARFRVRVAAIACAPLWQRRTRISGRKIGGTDVGVMDRLASERNFPWVTSSSEHGRARFPCELWQQEHMLLGSPESVVTICDVDVFTTPFETTHFPSRRVHLDTKQISKFGVHALATWTEVAAPSNSVDLSWWRTVEIATCGTSSSRFEPGACKQGVLLARCPFMASDEATIDNARPSKRPRRSNSPPAWIDVAATFDPARGELRLRATWDNGDSF